MEHAQFHIGLEFWCGGRRFRCTDVGRRVVVAIRVDGAEITTIDNGHKETRALSGAEAEVQGWFRGPPYTLAETVFDEDELEGCSLEGEV